MPEGAEGRKQDETHYLAALPVDGSTVGNGHLREELGWDEARYEAVKDALVEAGLVAKGRGRGGSVALTTKGRKGSYEITETGEGVVREQSATYQVKADNKPEPAPMTLPDSPKEMTPAKVSTPNLSSFIWAVADLLRGDYRQSDYGKVILPFTVLRRLDCVLEPTKDAVLAEYKKRTAAGLNPEPFLLRVSGHHFYNTSAYDLKTLMGDQDHIGENLLAYIQGFSAPVRGIFAHFDFHVQVSRLEKANLLYLVTEKFATVDLHPSIVTNDDMGTIFEELIRKFAELSNETAGEHFTPREVIRLMVNTLITEAQRAIDLLQERRTALISAAVTGQIDVRDHVLAEEATA